MTKQPIRKTSVRARQPAGRRNLLRRVLPWIMGALAVLFVGIVVFTAINQATPANGSGTPRLQVNQDRLDLGNRVFNQPVRATFTIKNVGDGTLKLETPRVATLLEGC